MNQLIPVIRWGKTYAKKIRLEIAYGYAAQKAQLPELINNLLESQGGERKYGEAPKGPKERELIEALGLEKTEE